MLQTATGQGEEHATARPRRHGASVRQPWTRGGAAEGKTPGAVRERQSSSEESTEAPGPVKLSSEEEA